MKTTFDLPDPLLRRAKAMAAAQGRPLRDLVAEAIEARLAVPTLPRERRSEPPPGEWQDFLATLELQPDGSYVNPGATDDDDKFFQVLEEVRAERLREQAAPFDAAPGPSNPSPSPGKSRARA